MTTSTQTAPFDTTTCDREPIHLPGSIQPHGFLLALEEPALVVRLLSENATTYLGKTTEALLGRPLADLLGAEVARDIADCVQNPVLEQRAVYLRRFESRVVNTVFNVIGHRRDGLLILEMEPATEGADPSFRQLHPQIESFLSKLGGIKGVRQLSQLAAEEVRRITGFDRVLVYRFDADWNGSVIAEDRNDRLPSYFDLRFPASDIPRQARDLYQLNRMRIIVDSDYTPVPLTPPANPLTGKPLDLSLSVLRSVSPIHLQYMKNMSTPCSMSIAVMRDGKLWGLVSCHHHAPRRVPFDVRAACDFIGQVFSLQLAEKENAALYEYRMRLRSVLSRLLAYMTGEENFVDGLVNHPDELMELTAAHGAAVVVNDRCLLVGETPTEAQVMDLAKWLGAKVRDEVFSTESLANLYPSAEGFAEKASGLLGISISKLHKSYILWFRPEVVQTVKWGGDPRKPVEPDAVGRPLNPRKSFEMWKETVRRKSLEWQAAEIETASEFRNVILGIVLRKAEELAELTRELERSNRELEAFSYSVSHDLRAPFRHIVGYAEILREQKSETLDADGRRYIDTIIESAIFAGTLVDNLLAFSQMGRSSLHPSAINLNRLIEDVKSDVMSEVTNRRVRWIVKELPTVRADPMMLKLAVRNLLANAVKYTGKREEAVIEIGSEERDRETVFYVRDNGVGFDMRYVDKLFGVFQRLHRMEEFEGTGIGLANVRRIISRHGGQTWAEGMLDKGATFYFSLPKLPPTIEADSSC